MAFSALVLLSLLYLSIHALALYSPSGPVALLNPKTFNAKIRNSKHATMVEFFAPWCGHCKNLAPGYTKAAEHMAGIFTFAAVDCDDQSNRALCQEFDIKGFPTIKFMKPFQGKLDVRDYNGPRTAKGLTDFAKENMENLVVRVTDDNLSSFLGNNNDTAKAIMFSKKGPTSALWKSLAIEFQGDIMLAQVRDTQEKVVKEYNVEKFPSLVVLPGGSAPVIVYTGDMERDPLYKFLSEYVSPPSTTASPVASKRQESTVDYTPKEISEIPELWETCFNTPGTCYLLLSPNEGDVKTFAIINQRINAKKTMRMFTTGLFEGKEALFEGALPRMIALNGGKGWYKRFEGSIIEKDVIEWIDTVRMGEGKKFPIPKGEEIMKLFGLTEATTSIASSTTTASISEASIETIMEDIATSTVSTDDDGVKEVFGDEKESVHDEL